MPRSTSPALPWPRRCRSGYWRITIELANILRETPISPSQSLDTRDGVHTLTATVRDSWQLGFWLLSQGPAIVVLKPGALRRRLISVLTKTLAAYTGG
jgi:hypothetical protein